MQAFTSAVAEYHRMQSAQVAALTRGDGFLFEIEIAHARDQRDLAKYAILEHQQEHGC